jgi:site-specific recombinase XerD
MFGSVELKRMSIHTGRPTFAKRLNEHGVSIKNIRTLMGHASIATTSISIEKIL